MYIGIQRRIISFNHIFFCGKAIPLGKTGDLPAGRQEMEGLPCSSTSNARRRE